MPVPRSRHLPLDLARQHRAPLVPLLPLPSSPPEPLDPLPSRLRPLRHRHSHSLRLHALRPPLRPPPLRQTPLRNLRHAALPHGVAGADFQTGLDTSRVLKRWQIPPAGVESSPGPSPPRRLRRHPARPLQALPCPYKYARGARNARGAGPGRCVF